MTSATGSGAYCSQLCQISTHQGSNTSNILDGRQCRVTSTCQAFFGSALSEVKAAVDMQAVQQMDARGKSGAAATQMPPEQRRMEAKMILKLGHWMADTGQGGRSDITGKFLSILSMKGLI